MAAALGKVRRPFGVWLLTVVTLGIYGLYWWYRVNAELADFDPEIEVSPGLATVALVVPLANIVTVVRTGGRIGAVQQHATGASGCSGLLGLLLALVGGFHLAYYQAKLNALWESQWADDDDDEGEETS